MARSQETFNKKEREKKKQQKRKEKEYKREERKGKSSDSSLENMMAYVDENGNLSHTPPDPTKRKEVELDSINISVPRTIEEEIDPVWKGKIDYFNHDKGFGFIKSDRTGESFFVHVNDLSEALNTGDKVSFELVDNPKGKKCVKVVKI